MSADLTAKPERTAGHLPDGEEIQKNVSQRRTVGLIWQWILFACTTIGIVALVVLMYTIIDEAFGITAVQTAIDPETLSERPLEELSNEELTTIIEENLSRRVLTRVERDGPLVERNQRDLLRLINTEILDEEVVGSWPLHEVLFNRTAIEEKVAEDFPRAELQFKTWIDGEFLTTPMSSTPALAGVRTAILGSLWMILITMLVAFPLGVGAAIYLEEYATDNWINRIIQTNINNLAGVPSIIYGILGLVIFVRLLSGLTQGRTIISGSLTMALLILPIIIIAGQEAIRAVPRSLRQASYGLGATKWQTIWHHILPNAFPGILTGTILSMSRAIGETAPLIVVGASTFITVDPTGPFSPFTALPIQIYNWTSQPQDQFRDIAAAAIVVLLIILLSLNATAILLRDYLNKKRV